MPSYEEITSLDIASPQGQQAALVFADRLYAERDVVGANSLLGVINRASDPTAVRTALALILPKLTLVSLPLLSETDLFESMSRDLVAMLDLDAELLLERLTIAVESLPPQRRAKLKQQLLDLLRHGTATLTATALAVSGQTKVPTLGNWVQVLAALPEEQSIEEFVTNLPNLASFAEADRDRIRQLGSVILFLRHTAFDVASLEEEISVKEPGGKLGVLEHGQVHPIAVGTNTPPPRPALPSGPLAATPHFTPEDEQEILAHAKKISAMDLTPSSAEDLAVILIDQIAQRLGLVFSDETLQRRFRTALIAQIKGIRPTRETLSLLMRDDKLGGLGLSEEKTNAVLAEVEVAAKRFHNAEGVAGLERERSRLLERQAAVPEPAPAPAPSLQPVAVAPSGPSPRFRPDAVPTSIAATKTLRSNPVRMVQPRPFTSDRQQLQDIRPGARIRQTVGPVDELRGLSLSEFRQIGANTSTSIVKLKEKFNALAKESYALRVQGVVGWRQSPLYYLYLTMGNESMNERQPITAVVASRAQRGEETLTVDEFRAIADLNRSLRF